MPTQHLYTSGDLYGAVRHLDHLPEPERELALLLLAAEGRGIYLVTLDELLEAQARTVLDAWDETGLVSFDGASARLLDPASFPWTAFRVPGIDGFPRKARGDSAPRFMVLLDPPDEGGLR